MRDGYSVTVSKNGVAILTIERSMVSGDAEISKDDAAAIRDAGEHLLSFIGPETSVCFACGWTEGHAQDCSLGEVED